MKKNTIIILLLLVCGALAAAVNQVDSGVEFTFSAPNAGSVSVAGSFNGWDTNANPLQKADDGIWKTVIDLPAGAHTYKYVVDGNWVFDDENPSVEDDGYGGSNSLVEVNASGTMAKTQNAKPEMPSSVNPKVYFDGRYYVNNKMYKDDMSRYDLEKPYHDLNLGIKVKLNSNMEGYTVLNINNTREGVDMWKTHLNYKRTVLRLNADYLDLVAFDNFGEIRFDDPLHIVGAQGYYNHAFGYDYRGVNIKTDNSKIPYLNQLPIKFHLNGFGADQVGDDERDAVALRLKTEYEYEHDLVKNTFSIGGSAFSSRMNNSYSHVFNDSVSYSEGVVDVNSIWEIDGRIHSQLKNPNWNGSFDFALDYEHYEFENRKEYKETELYYFFTDDQHIWQDGSQDYFCFSTEFPQALSLRAFWQQNKVNLYYEDFSNNLIELPSPDIKEAELTRNIIGWQADFDSDNLSADITMKHWSREYPDSVASWNDYYRFMERTDGNGKWYQEQNELSFARYFILGYDTALTWNIHLNYKWEKFAADYKADIAQYDLSYTPELIDNCLRLTYDLNKHWQICTDTRLPVYNSEFLDLKTDFSADEDVFVSNYTALKYHLSDYVWIALSYGVNPTVISSVTDNFYEGGRREFLEEEGNLDGYLLETYNNFGEKVRQAEDALSKDDRISLEAVIQF